MIGGAHGSRRPAVGSALSALLVVCGAVRATTRHGYTPAEDAQRGGVFASRGLRQGVKDPLEEQPAGAVGLLLLGELCPKDANQIEPDDHVAERVDV